MGSEVEHVVEGCLTVAQDHAAENAVGLGEELGRTRVLGQGALLEDQNLVVLNDRLDSVGDRDDRSLCNQGRTRPQ